MHMRIALALTLGLLLTIGAGCTSSGVLSDAEAEARAETAMQSFAAAMSDRDGDQLRSMVGSMSGSSEADPDDPFGMGGFESDFEMHWGTGDVVHLILDAGSGGFSMQVEAWCTPTQMLLKWGSDVFESRPSAEPEEDELCPADDAEEDLTEGTMFGSEEFESLEMVDVEQLEDGTLRATYHDPAENMTAEALIDTKGRITHMEMESPEMVGSFDVTYGARDNIVLPEATARIPATVWSHDSTQENQLEGTVTDAPEFVPLDEMELHLVRVDFESDTERVAGIALSAGSGTDGDYEFTYMDNDNDGRVSENDTFTISGPEIGTDHMLSAAFYDTWADGYANENPIPAPGLVLTLVGLVAVAFVLRRRA